VPETTESMSPTEMTESVPPTETTESVSPTEGPTEAAVAAAEPGLITKRPARLGHCSAHRRFDRRAKWCHGNRHGRRDYGNRGWGRCPGNRCQVQRLRHRHWRG
jgi:hypothetical protein